MVVTHVVLKVLCHQDGIWKTQHHHNCDVFFKGEGKWFRNIDYYRLDGSTNATTRKKWAEEFNDTNNVR